MHAPLFDVVDRYMVWNAFLAVVPVALAVVLFRRRATRNVAWWAAFIGWVLFLPNAPYVLTDVTHLVDDMHWADSKVQAYEYIVVFGVLFGIGLTSYVIALELFRRYLRHAAVPAPAVAATLLVLHGLCVIAMYLGRSVRVNSWDAVVAPGTVVRALLRMPRPGTIALLILMFVVVGSGAFVTKAVGDKVLTQARRFL